MLLGIIAIAVIGVVIGGYFLFRNTATKDALRFKEEYEALNSELNDDGSHKYTKLSIEKNNKIVYLSYEDVVDFANNGTGLLYFGRPGCPWCRLLVPTLLSFAKEKNINIYYYDIESDRDENNDKYKNILSLFGEYLPIDTVTQKEDDPDFDENLKRVVLPQLFFMKDGLVKDELYAYQHDYLKNNESNKMHQLLFDKYESIINSCSAKNDC